MGALQPFFTTYPWPESFSEVLDVRSPAEFAEDHVPGAVNLPVLSDSERAEVGTLYKQVSPFIARKRGASLVSRNISEHLSTYLADMPKDYAPVVYCWRGGQRSFSMATILSQVGWRTGVLSGGYKTYRKHVRQQLETVPRQFQFNVLCGLTGTAKTEILRRLSSAQTQVLDLEKLANHRGSLLGREVDSPQPSQKQFDSDLLSALEQFDPKRPLWVEAESNKIGQIFIPSQLWTRLKQGRCVEILAPVASRVSYLVNTYPQFSANLPTLMTELRKLKQRYGKAQIDQWQVIIERGSAAEIVRSLLAVHYDPAYRKSMGQQYLNQVDQISLSELSSDSLDAAVQQLAAFTSAQSSPNHL
ncbi:MAG: tRNA 2-selenouridine(34) synthase MnmH [Cyanobacteria bacterium P01_F01_bin.42]